MSNRYRKNATGLDGSASLALPPIAPVVATVRSNAPGARPRRLRRRLWALAVLPFVVAGLTLVTPGPAHAAAPPAAWEPFARYFVSLTESNGLTSSWSTSNGGQVFGEFFGPSFNNTVSLGGTAQGSPGVALNNSGKAHVFVVGTNNAVFVKWEILAGDPRNFTSSWYNLGGGCISNPAVFRNTYTHEMELFCLGTNGAVYERWQTSPGGGWSSWTSLGGNGISRVVAGNSGSSGGAFVEVYGTDGRLYIKQRANAGSAWGAWQRA